MADLRLLFSELTRLHAELWNALDDRLCAECDLPLSRFEPMRVIASLNVCRVQDIADELVITVGGVSKLVDRIEAAGYCRRRANPDDRRSSLVELTATGKRMLAKAIAIVDRELEDRLGSAVSERSLQQFVTILTRLRSTGRSANAAAEIA